MKIFVRYHMDAIAILQIKGGLTKASALSELHAKCREFSGKGIRAVLVNLSQCSRVNMAGLAALVELAGRQSTIHVAYCGLGPMISRKLQVTGLDRGLCIHACEEDAFQSRPFKSATLAHTKALILCNDDPRRMNPITKSVPTCLLDFLGKPLVARLHRHLETFGVEDVFVNPSHFGNQVFNFFHGVNVNSHRVRFSNEGYFQNGTWTAKPMGTAGSIAQIQEKQSAFYEDFFVLAGNSLVNVDLAAMMQHHKAHKADVTIATNIGPDADHGEANMLSEAASVSPHRYFGSISSIAACPTAFRGSVYIFSPQALDCMKIKSGWDIDQDLLPALSALGRKINIFRSAFQSIEISSAHQYARGLQQALNGQFSNLLEGSFEGENAWHSQRSEISPRARISGQNYIGPGARVGAGVELLGNCVIGANTEISGPCIIENSIVFPDTHIAAGFWAQDMTIHRDWAFDHRFEEKSAAALPLNLMGTTASASEQNRKSA